MKNKNNKKNVFKILFFISTIVLLLVLSIFYITLNKDEKQTVKLIENTVEVTLTSIPTQIPTNIPTPVLTEIIINKNREDITSCIEEDRLLDEIKDECGSNPFPGIEECIQMRIDRAEVELKESNLERADNMKRLSKLYGISKVKCKLDSIK